MTTFAEIWNTLSKVNVNEHIEKKMNLSYLSWAWAWGILMEIYPESTYIFQQPEVHDDGSMTVICTIEIGGRTRTMWLPVMDHKNKAIKKPDARDISDAKMRCLVKCLALFGLGHYIYAGEDVPQTPGADRTVPTVDRPEHIDTFKSVFEKVVSEGGTLAFRELWSTWKPQSGVDDTLVKDCKLWIKDHDAAWLQDLKAKAQIVDEERGVNV